MINWDLWHTLLAVSRQGTYVSASRVLQVDPTTIGRKLKNLEHQLGYKLFVRDNDRLHPTSQCEILLTKIEAAEEALREIDGVPANAANEAIWREIRITAPPFLVSHLLAPQLTSLVQNRHIKVELMGTSNKQLLSRREADMALRIEDDPNEEMRATSLIGATKLGLISYAIYFATGGNPDDMPWAGLIERHRRTTGVDAQNDVAGLHGIRYRVSQFEELREIVSSGAAKAMLPRLIAGRDDRLDCASDTVLQQPLWLLYHGQDERTNYFAATREWISRTALDMLDQRKIV